jgi:hypothetical protein
MVDGQGEDESRTNVPLNLEAVFPGHFATLGVALARGRAFTPSDGEGSPAVAIVTEDAAARIWPGRDPIGRRIRFGGESSNEPWRTIVGIVRPIRYRELARALPSVYVPAPQFIVAASTLLVRTSLPPSTAAAVIHEQVRAVDSSVRVTAVTPFRPLLDGPLGRPRFNAFVVGVFALSSLLLAAVGLYAVVAASVRHRQVEIGVRLALGATPARVRRLVVGEGLRLAAMGAVVGLAAALASARLLRGLLFEVDVLDPASFVATAVLLAGAAALATARPAQRAARVDPATLLRTP